MLWYSWACQKFLKSIFRALLALLQQKRWKFGNCCIWHGRGMHVSLCYIAVLKPSWNFFNQINTAENSNISFWCLQNCTIVSELKIQFLARATLLQWKRSYLKFRLCSSQSLSMKQELVEYWWATLKSWGGNPRQHFCYQERYWYYFFADRTHTHTTCHLSPKTSTENVSYYQYVSFWHDD